MLCWLQGILPPKGPQPKEPSPQLLWLMALGKRGKRVINKKQKVTDPTPSGSSLGDGISMLQQASYFNWT